MRRTLVIIAALIACWISAAPSLALTINVTGTGFTSSQLAAFNRAADQWEARIDDPITVTISGSFGSTGGAAQASFGLVGSSYANVRSRMINRAANDSSGNDGIVASLPTNINFAFSGGTLINPNIFMTLPNARALGFTTSLGNDGTITFSNTLSWDYDNSNGVSGFDFESVAAHEIGHILGFADNVGSTTSPFAMDVFRFNRSSNNPATVSEFTNFNRELRSGQDTAFDIISTELRHSGPGDGFSPAHWFNAGAGNEIGVMDPQIVNGTIVPVNDNDLLLLDVIGYSVTAVPEPSAYALGLLGLIAFVAVGWRARGRRGI